MIKPVKKTSNIALCVVFVTVAAWGILRFIFGGPEDTWLCQNGQWIKHGNPAKPPPDTGCGEASSQKAAEESKSC
ncbi:MAG TPA: hypothetical protein VMW41_02080 [Candidatus Bathyarchaeia archaeon]|nr:hypothetical protein [Candidatus Bathyarchaeia archaeon]